MDINSIFPIIIKIIKQILVELKKLIKFIFDKPYNEELVVLVIVKIDILNEFSKLILSKTNMLERIKRLIKKDIKTKKDNFIFSLSIFLSEYNIFWLKTLLGLTSLIISIKEDLRRINILSGLIPEVVEITDPPTIVKNRRYKEKLFSISPRAIPDVEILLNTLAKDWKISSVSTDSKSKIEKKIAKKIIKKSS